MADHEFSGEKISYLRKSVEELMSGFRLRHTLGVEEMAARIGQIYCPEKENVLRAAALLHDITKELAKDEQIALCISHGYEPAKEELARHGIACDGKRAVQLTRADAEKYDIFVGMDSANIRNMHRILGDGARDKIFKLMSFAGKDAGGVSVSLSVSLNVIPASVVFEIINLISGCSASLRYSSNSRYGFTQREITLMIPVSTPSSPRIICV